MERSGKSGFLSKNLQENSFWVSSHKRLFLEIPEIADRCFPSNLQWHFSPLPQQNHSSTNGKHRNSRSRPEIKEETSFNSLRLSFYLSLFFWVFSFQKSFSPPGHKRLFSEIPEIADRCFPVHLQYHFFPLPQTNHPSRTRK